MSGVATGRISDEGAVLLPEDLRLRHGLTPGSPVLAEERLEGIVIRSAEEAGEQFSPERIAEFLLNNAADAEDYAQAVEEVRRLGLRPEDIPHEKPPGI